MGRSATIFTIMMLGAFVLTGYSAFLHSEISLSEALPVGQYMRLIAGL